MTIFLTIILAQVTPLSISGTKEPRLEEGQQNAKPSHYDAVPLAEGVLPGLFQRSLCLWVRSGQNGYYRAALITGESDGDEFHAASSSRPALGPTPEPDRDLLCGRAVLFSSCGLRHSSLHALGQPQTN